MFRRIWLICLQVLAGMFGFLVGKRMQDIIFIIIYCNMSHRLHVTCVTRNNSGFCSFLAQIMKLKIMSREQISYHLAKTLFEKAILL